MAAKLAAGAELPSHMPSVDGAAALGDGDGDGNDGSLLLDLPRTLLTAIALCCSNPTSLFASCRTLRALGADPAVELVWFVRNLPAPAAPPVRRRELPSPGRTPL
jgi:hypothetical protein